ncbi:MAG: hypothetical protein ABEJ02_02980 [Candidatus Paceibacteria bacterium]
MSTSKQDAVRPGRSTVSRSKNVKEPQNARIGGDSTVNIAAKLQRRYDKNLLPLLPNVPGVHRLNHELQQLAIKNLEKVDKSNASKISDFDWDNLLILDACRHDLYEEVKGNSAASRITVGGATHQFIKETFTSQSFEDTLLVTANPQFSNKKFKEYTGRKVEDVFHTVFHTWKNKWDEKENTVQPEKVVEDVKTAEKLFPSKRKLVVFLQPHQPFIGKDYNGDGLVRSKFFGGETYETVFDKAEKGELGREKVWKGYRENLELAIKVVEDELLPVLSGKTVLTSDHGNLVGEAGYYGHPAPLKSVKVLRKVPLVELDKGGGDTGEA